MGATHSLVALSGAVVIASQTTTDYTHAGLFIGGCVMHAKGPDVDIKLHIPHRGPTTHSLLAVLLYSAVVYSVAAHFWPEYALVVGGGVCLGLVLHLLADALTISGVPLLWPVVRGDIHLLPRGWRVRTDGRVESVLAFLLSVGLLGFLWFTYGAAYA